MLHLLGAELERLGNVVKNVLQLYLRYIMAYDFKSGHILL